MSNSPSLAEPTKAIHSAFVNMRAGPVRFLLSRTATPVSRKATSTQLLPPDPLLRLALRQTAPSRWCASNLKHPPSICDCLGALRDQQALDHLECHAMVERLGAQSLELSLVTGN